MSPFVIARLNSSCAGGCSAWQVFCAPNTRVTSAVSRILVLENTVHRTIRRSGASQ